MNSFTDNFTINGITLTAQPICRQSEVLTPDALAFVAKLHRATAGRRQELLQARQERRHQISKGQDPRFLRETESVRNDPNWRVAPPAPGLEDRRVEITGPVDKKMTINALNSGAKVWLADMEDSSTPSWRNVIQGQLNLTDALERRIDFTTPEGKEYKLRPAGELPTIVVRPRGWHLPEKHMLIDGTPVAGGIVDFGLYFFHNARRLIAQGKGPYFYLPKIENHLEARLWNDIFILAQDLLGIPQGTIRATVLIETITAAFEMEEILYELRDHAAGLNAGRWDYIFSLIKNFRTRGPRFVLPDRGQVTMTQPFMRAYTEQLVRACHKRGAMAIGGMAAAVPNRKDQDANAIAFEKVRADKTREAGDGFDGSWVAHPDLVPVCREVFDAVLGERPNQLERLREDVTPDDRAAPGHLHDHRNHHRTGHPEQHRSGDPLHRVLAARQRRRGHPQPDGGRRHRGNLPLAAVAVDLRPGHHRPRRRGHPGVGGGHAGRGIRQAGALRRRPFRRRAGHLRGSHPQQRVPGLPDAAGLRPLPA